MATRPLSINLAEHSDRDWRRLLFKQVQVLLDVLVLISAFELAYLLRFDFSIPGKQFSEALAQLPVVIFVELAILQLSGIYRFIWRYIGLAEMKRFVAAALWTMLPLLLL